MAYTWTSNSSLGDELTPVIAANIASYASKGKPLVRLSWLYSELLRLSDGVPRAVCETRDGAAGHGLAVSARAIRPRLHRDTRSS